MLVGIDDAAAFKLGSVSYFSEYICPCSCWIPLISPACMPISPVAEPSAPMPCPIAPMPCASPPTALPNPAMPVPIWANASPMISFWFGIDRDLEVLDVLDALDRAAHADGLSRLAKVDRTDRERQVGRLQLLDDALGRQALVFESLGIERDPNRRRRVGGELRLAHSLDALQSRNHVVAHVGPQQL